MAGEFKVLQFASGVSVSAPTQLLQSYEEEDTSNWDGATLTHTYDVSSTVTDARKMDWSFQDAANNRRILRGADIEFPTATQVKVSFDIAPANGTYWLVGAGGG